MKNPLAGCAIQIPICSTAHLAQRRLECPHKIDSRNNKMNKHRERVENLALRLQEHVRLGPKITETVKRKLSLGAKILQVGGVAKVFKQNFSIREGEKLLKTFHCHLSTTAGPISGLLFISTDKFAFRSERSIKISSPTGEMVRIHYKVSIPLRKIKTTNKSKNVEKPSLKYIEIVTVDNFDFWFMGFLNYQKTFNYLQQALSQVQ
ncbi:hypothetical protein LguiB_025413 [Lonicera macranthoides]